MSWTALAQKWLGHRWTPAALAFAAVVVMLPALDTGLGMDDLLQRVFQLKPDQVPQAIRDTGLVHESGTLRVVLSDLFGFNGNRQAIAQARNYGVLPWWTSEDLKAALWRPLTALTHWADYRLFPNSPVLMHAHSIAWFAGVVFLATLVYREILGPGWVAGLAGLLFLLDKNTYFPVMFVANRGFVISLFFGLLAVYEHHRWRCTKARLPFLLSIVALLASLLSNEAGVSALAFLLAYAFCLELQPSSEDAGARPHQPWNWLKLVGRRLVPTLPAVATVVAWRLVYQSLGHRVANVGAYLDPSQEPFVFLGKVLPRSIAILAGQLTGLPPEFAMGLRPSLEKGTLVVGCAVVAIVVIGLLPVLLRERVARFWFVALLLALVPAATVVPIGKNLGFVAVAAFGLIAVFVNSVVTPLNQSLGPSTNNLLARLVCVGLLVAHVPGAIAGRIAAAKIGSSTLAAMGRFGDIGSPKIGDRDVVVLNVPCSLALMETPFARFYNGQELPKTLRSLAPGCIGLEVERPDAKTLMIRPSGPNLFYCRDVGPFDLSYAFWRINQMFQQPAFKRGYRAAFKGLEVEVLQVDAQGLPAAVAFRFDTSLDSPSFRWVYFDWKSLRFRELKIPAAGESTYILGPREG